MQHLTDLDPVDIRILRTLQRNGRLTNHELAAAINLSPSQCSRRRARLEENGFIIACPAVLDRERLGYELTVFVSVTLNTHTPDNARRFADLVRRLPNVLEAYSLTGEMDYQIKLVVRNLPELSAIINESLMSHPSVQTLKSSIVLDKLKETTETPI